MVTQRSRFGDLILLRRGRLRAGRANRLLLLLGSLLISGVQCLEVVYRRKCLLPFYYGASCPRVLPECFHTSRATNAEGAPWGAIVL